MCDMTPAAQHALRIIRDCLAKDRVVIVPHFMDRMEQRGMAWGDVLAVFDAPDAPGKLRDAGRDRYDRPRWIARGKAADMLDVEIVCVLDRDDRGNVTVFITIYDR